MLNTPENTPPAPNLGNLATSPAQTLSDAEIDAQIEARIAQLRIAAGAVNEADASTSNMPQPTAFAPIKHTLAFSGSGSEYFRIWIVNLLLTIVTLTLYSPWAKVRKLQYFYRNTTLDAQPFDYHANPWALFKGRLVALALLGAYTLAGYLGTTATLAFGALIVLIGPWLIWRSLQFRMANTSYRAVRFGFTGSLKGAYWVFGIATIVVVTYLVSIAFVAQLAAEGAGKGKSIKFDFFGFMALFSLVPFLFPWWHQIMKKYQHQHYAWASLNTGFFATVGDFYSRWLKYVGVSFLIGVVFVLFMVLMSTIGLGSVFGNTTQNSTGAISAKMLIIVIFGSLVFLAAYAAFVCLFGKGVSKLSLSKHDLE